MADRANSPSGGSWWPFPAPGFASFMPYPPGRISPQQNIGSGRTSPKPYENIGIVSPHQLVYSGGEFFMPFYNGLLRYQPVQPKPKETQQPSDSIPPKPLSMTGGEMKK